MDERKLRHFIYDEVVIHNTRDDFWVVIHRNVLDLTPFLRDRIDSWNNNLEYLLAFGGKDISRYFHKDGYPRTEISVKTGKPRVIFYPILETAQSTLCKTPGRLWSRDPFYHIGQLTKQERRLRIINVPTSIVNHMTVCEEDTVSEIKEKYRNLYNSHAGSYIWKKGFAGQGISTRLHADKTLSENGIFKEKTGPPPFILSFFYNDFTIM